MSPAKGVGNENAGAGRATELRLDDKIRRWRYVERELRESASLEAHVSAVVAALLVIADTGIEVESLPSGPERPRSS